MNSTKTLEQDRAFVWHPFTQHKGRLDPIVIERAKGQYLYTSDGRKLFDAVSSWWVNIHGHCHPYLVEKISEQLATLDHVIFAEKTHKPAVELAKKLVELTPSGLAKVFYSDNGSTAVEVALKMALQYWHNLGESKKRVLAFKNSYHGDTFGAMSVSQASALNVPFQDKFFPVDFIDPPLRGQENRGLQQLKDLVQKNRAYACFIYEPLVQGAGGMLMQEATELDEILAFAKAENILCIADEVMTGFGRTGKIFASEFLTQKPDIMCLAKGLTGGVLPLSATLCTNSIYEAFLSDDKTKAFFHGHSFTANPVGCAAGLASYDILMDPKTTEQRAMIQSCHKDFCSELLQSSYKKFVKDCRVQGTIVAVELKTEGQTDYFNLVSEKIKSFVKTTDIMLRPLGNVIYIIPPYCSSKEDLGQTYKVIYDCIRYLFL